MNSLVRWSRKAVVMLMLLIGLLLFASMDATTQMGINGHVTEYKIPLYLKVLNFYDRHFNYRHLAKQITVNSGNEREAALSTALWVVQNIKKVPVGVEIVDNHPWTIVERRLGGSDQFSDILSVLLVYAGIDAFFRNIETTQQPGSGRYPLTFFLIDSTWSVIDPYQGFYFVNDSGAFASLVDLKKGSWKAMNIEDKVVSEESLIRFYSELFSQLPSREEINRTNIYERGGRANTQNPIGRFLFQLHRD